MTTIILTMIGILLAAAAALMAIFYGGEAFNSGTIGAEANQIQNAGANVAAALQMYKAEQASAPRGLNQLTQTGSDRPNGAYLDELPALPEGSTQSLVPLSATTRMYYVFGVRRSVCDRINSNLGNGIRLSHEDEFEAATAARIAPQKMGCMPTAETGVFFARA